MEVSKETTDWYRRMGSTAKKAVAWLIARRVWIALSFAAIIAFRPELAIAILNNGALWAVVGSLGTTAVNAVMMNARDREQAQAIRDEAARRQFFDLRGSIVPVFQEYLQARELIHTERNSPSVRRARVQALRLAGLSPNTVLFMACFTLATYLEDVARSNDSLSKTATGDIGWDTAIDRIRSLDEALVGALNAAFSPEAVRSWIASVQNQSPAPTPPCTQP